MRKFLNTVKSFRKDEDGAALAEYAVLLAIVLALGVTALTTFSTSISGVFTKAVNLLNGIS
jgi:pilus assembly protein Flp/PilA